MSAREELEAVIRQQLTRAVANAIQARVPSTGIMNRATEEILKAAAAYARDTGPQLAKRPAADPPPAAVHLTRGGRTSVCGAVHRASESPGTLTTVPGEVTCGRCKMTGTYRAALGEAS